MGKPRLTMLHRAAIVEILRDAQATAIANGDDARAEKIRELILAVSSNPSA